MRTVDLIERKRDGGRLEAGEIAWLIRQYTDGVIPDYQMSAMLMAVYINGLNREELFAWVDAMLESGDKLDLAGVDKPKVDKHSTGGVGDKVSISLGPMVAACGVAVPMISGRGLGHTGGTLDKLESIPGFATQLELPRIKSLLAKTGLVFAGQSQTLVPADRKLYALRDATGTVANTALMASSIMSKKMAENLDGLVLDVKVGSGAFLQDPGTARQLAETMVSIGVAYGIDTVALITGMDAPIGREVGNANEIAESIAVLKGDGPPDLVELVFALGAQMLLLAGVASDRGDAQARLQTTLDSGAALQTFARVVEAQGGNPRIIDSVSLLPHARHSEALLAAKAGTVTGCDARQIGVAAMALGAGRETKDDRIDPAVGVTLLAKPGDAVARGEPLARIAWNDENRLAEAMSVLEDAWTIGNDAPVASSLVQGEIRS